MADQADQALHDHRTLTVTLIVVSSAPGRPAELAATVTPLRLGAGLIEVDTGAPDAAESAVTAVRSALSL